MSDAGGLKSWLTTTDHKRIGLLYFWTALGFFLVGGIEALFIRVQLAQPNGRVVSAETYNQLFTMHGTTMIFLALMPLGASFFNYMVPLQIGARDVAFPRLNAFSYWVFLFGGLFLNASWFVGPLFHAGMLNVAPNGGWFGYANLTERQYSAGPNIDFWMLGLQVLGISSLAAGFNFIVTILNMRAPGMRMMRLPVFTWMTLVTQFLIVTAFPVITVGLAFLMFDRFFGTHFYVREAGATPILWQHLFWLFGHPEVYILILPAMGVVSDVLPTFSRKPLFGYTVVVYSGVLIGLMSWGVWSHHMFAVGLGPIADSVFAGTTMLIAIPTGVKIFNWLGTLWGGDIRGTTALHFAVGFIAMFIIGGLSGVSHASPPADLQQTDTYYVVAHIHYVFFGGTILSLFAGIYYWWPKMTGRLLNESLGTRRGRTQSRVHDRRLPDRPRDPHLSRQLVAQPHARSTSSERSVGRGDTGVERLLAPAGLQLLGDPHGHEPPAALEHGASRADAGSARHAAGAHPRAGRIVVAPGRGARPAGHGACAAHPHPLGRLRRCRAPDRGDLSLGVRAP